MAGQYFHPLTQEAETALETAWERATCAAAASQAEAVPVLFGRSLQVPPKVVLLGSLPTAEAPPSDRLLKHHHEGVGISKLYHLLQSFTSRRGRMRPCAQL